MTRPDLASQRTGARQRKTKDARDYGVVCTIERAAELTPEAASMWDLIVGSLSAQGLLREGDGFVLEELCEALVAAKTARRALQAMPRSRWGTAEAKRLRVTYADAMQLVLKLSGSFGLTPQSRLRLGMTQAKGMGAVWNLRRAMAAAGEDPAVED